MKWTVEKGKTLLVDGPASVAVTSGKVEVFGSIVGNAGRIVIREGKRMPFAAEEKATLDISLGEYANIEEVDGITVPPSWVKSGKELLNFQVKPVTAMVLGTVDSGKSSFCTYLINKLLLEKRTVALLDGDLGQSDIGPPCTVAYAFIAKPITDLFNIEARNAFFVGVTSPSGAIDKAIEGMMMLKKEIFGQNPDFIVINTDGWIEGEDATKYKVQLVEKIGPDIVFYIQKKDELLLLSNAPEKFKKVVVDSPSAIRQRSKEKRRSLRELGYIKYLRKPKTQSLPLSWIKIEGNELLGSVRIHENTKQVMRVHELLGMKPLHVDELKDKIYVIIGKGRWVSPDSIKKVEEYEKKKVMIVRNGEEEGLLAALYAADRKFLGIGLIQEIDYVRKALKVFTSVSEEVSTVVLGKVKLDKNLRETSVAEENQLDLEAFRRVL